MHIAPGRQDGRGAQQVTAGGGPQESAVQRFQNTFNFAVLHERAVGGGQFSENRQRGRCTLGRRLGQRDVQRSLRAGAGDQRLECDTR